MIDQRISYRYGGDTMGGPNDKSKGSSTKGPSAPPGGGATSMGSGRDYSPGGNSPRERGITQQYEGPKGTTGSIAGITDKGPDRSVADSAPQRTRDILEEFTSFRPQIDIPNYMIGMKTFQPFIQKFSDISAEQNRGFFADPDYQFGIGPFKFGPDKSVLEAGRYQLPGELGEKYGKFGYEDIAEMTPEELDQAYKGYLKARSLNEIDAYGNPIIGGRGQDENPLQNLLLAQQLANPTAAPSENLQGGIAQLYSQYLKNLGSL